MKKTLSLLALLATQMVVASATTVVIDDFSSNPLSGFQQVCHPAAGFCPVGQATNSATGLSNVLGGSRTLTVNRSSGTIGFVSANTEAGALRFASPDSAAGTLVVTWSPVSFDASAGTDTFLFDLLFTDNPAMASGGTWKLDITSSSFGVVSSGPTAIPMTYPTTVAVPFAAFTGNPAAFSDIDQIRFTYAGNIASDATFDTFRFDSSVPEPSTFVLLGSALAGLGLLRRRSQA